MELNEKELSKYVLSGGDLSLLSLQQINMIKNSDLIEYVKLGGDLQVINYYNPERLALLTPECIYASLVAPARKIDMDILYRYAGNKISIFALNSRQLNNLIYNCKDIPMALNVLYNKFELDAFKKSHNFLDVDRYKQFILTNKDTCIDMLLRDLPKHTVKQIATSFSKRELKQVILNGNYDSDVLNKYLPIVYKKAVYASSDDDLKLIILDGNWSGTQDKKLAARVNKVIKNFTQEDVNKIIENGVTHIYNLDINKDLLHKALTVNNFVKCLMKTGNYPSVLHMDIPKDVRKSVPYYMSGTSNDFEDAYKDLVLGQIDYTKINSRLYANSKFTKLVREFETFKERRQYVLKCKDFYEDGVFPQYLEERFAAQVKSIDDNILKKQKEAFRIAVADTNVKLEEYRTNSSNSPILEK